MAGQLKRVMIDQRGERRLAFHGRQKTLCYESLVENESLMILTSFDAMPNHFSGRLTAHYHPIQILLHWLVVVLIAIQYATSGPIQRTHEAVAAGFTPDPSDVQLHTVHNYVGMMVIAVMVVRLGLRWWFRTGRVRSIDQNSIGEDSWRDRAASFVHLAFYGVVIAQGLTGLVASYLWWPASNVHEVLFKVLLALIALHLIMAFWHQLVLRDGVLKRMVWAPSRGTGSKPARTREGRYPDA